MRGAMRGALGLVLVAWAGCGGASGDPIPFESYPEVAAPTSCARLFECCDDAELDRVFSTAMPPVTSESECIPYFESTLGSLYDMLQPYVDDGTVVWDAALAGDCLARYQDLPCADTAMAVGIESCRSALRGTLGAGAACESPFQCVSLSCADVVMGVGTCRDVPGEGEPCVTSCTPGWYCDRSTTTPTCRRALEPGDACTSPVQCTTGTCTDGTCAVGAAFCDGR